MLFEVIDINIEDSNLETPAKLYAYRPNLLVKNQPNRKMPAVIICPGGGYVHLSEREGEPVALKYLAAGYQAYVLQYHVAPAVYPTALFELAKSVQILREHAKEWYIDEQRIIVSGFSAGGHLAGCLACHYDKPFLSKTLKTDSKHIRPDGCILSYPVITSGEYAHRGSFEHLLATQQKEQLLEVSLEHQVSEHTPPMFIWHTYTDSTVPVENSLFMVAALRKNHISTEFHMFPEGCHGMALANKLTQMSDGRGVQEECQSWIDMAIRWIENLGGKQC